MLLSALQSQALRILSDAAALQIPGVTVFKVDTADSASLYAEGLAACGTSIGVLPPFGEFKPNSSEGPVSDEGGIQLLVNISEPVELARAQGIPPVTDLAETVAWLLHSSNHSLADGDTPARVDDIPLGVRRIALVPDKELLVYQVTCVCVGSLQPPESSVLTEDPAIL